jgi:hypothetical protein
MDSNAATLRTTCVNYGIAIDVHVCTANTKKRRLNEKFACFQRGENVMCDDVRDGGGGPRSPSL